MRQGLAWAVSALLLCGGLAAHVPARADSSASDVKAAFVYNFAKFVEWPRATFPEEHSPLQLCTWGQPFEGRLSLLNGREAQGRPIRVRALESADAMGGCHILVMGETPEAIRSQLLDTQPRPAVLTISDNRDFIQQGGMIGLFVTANRVQFSVNLGSAQGAGLKLSARLLQLAHGVRGETP